MNELEDDAYDIGWQDGYLTAKKDHELHLIKLSKLQNKNKMEEYIRKLSKLTYFSHREEALKILEDIYE